MGLRPPQSATRILFIGAYAYAREVLAALHDAGERPDVLTAHGRNHQYLNGPTYADGWVRSMAPDLIIVAGWRRLLPPEVLAIPRLGVVGFHSAKLPEYPGRAPVPWALLRGDPWTENTLLYLDEGVDSGDVIDRRRIPILQTDTPERLYHEMAETSVDMLLSNLTALKAGTALRDPQDPALRGPLTTPDGWDLWRASRSS